MSSHDMLTVLLAIAAFLLVLVTGLAYDVVEW